jgi:ADP-ribose pyrophosphatase YjhB (NUDIX family)
VYKVEDGLIQVLLVSSTREKNLVKWVLPKGGVEMELTERDSAAKEVYEESGALGVPGRSLGTVRMFKNAMMHNIEMFAMQFQSFSDHWPEAEIRERSWFEAHRALNLIDPYMAPFVWDVIQGLEANAEHESRKAG